MKRVTIALAILTGLLVVTATMQTAEGQWGWRFRRTHQPSTSACANGVCSPQVAKATCAAQTGRGPCDCVNCTCDNCPMPQASYTQVCEGGICRLVPRAQAKSVMVSGPQRGPDRPLDEEAMANAVVVSDWPVEQPVEQPSVVQQALSIVEAEEVVLCPECPAGYRYTGRTVMVVLPSTD